MEEQTQTENQSELRDEKPSKKAAKKPTPLQASPSSAEGAEIKASIKITFEGEAAQKILRYENELKERLSKPDMGKIIGAEILTWTDKRWSEIVEENTDIEYFFAQIRKCPDKSKSIKLLKAISEKLKSESSEGSTPSGLPVASGQEAQSQVV